MSYTKITLAGDRDLWERQPGETPAAYARFLTYRDLRPSERTYPRVAELSGRTDRTIKQLGASHCWQDRVAAWDTHQANQRHTRLRENDEELGRAVMQAARSATAVVLTSIRTIAESGETLEPKDVPRWADAVERLRRIALDRPEAVIEVAARTNQDRPATADDLAALTPEERRARIREMSERLVTSITNTA